MVKAEDGYGTYGDKIKWHFYQSTGHLEITGSGQMPEEEAPWHNYQNKIKSVTIGEGITSIFEGSFCEYKNLTKVTLPSTMKNIGIEAFRKTGITSVTLPEGLEVIAYQSFESCQSLTAITIPASVKRVEACAFMKCSNLSKITINEGVEELGFQCFQETKIKSIHIPSSIRIIEEKVFSRCEKLTYVIIPATVESAGNDLFEYCSSLQWADIRSHGRINHGMFWDCENLIAVKLGDNITGIDDYAFLDCDYLKGVYVPESVTEISEYILKDNKKCIFYGWKDSAAWAFAGISDDVSFVDVSTDSGMEKWNTLWKQAKATKITSANAKITLSSTTYTYNGNVRTPKVTVKYGSKTLKKGTDYTLTYAKGRKKVGNYSVKITFIENYTGTVTKYFKIKPVKTYITSLTKGKKAFTVKISKKSVQVTGYQVRYSRSSKFSSYVTKTITSYKTTKKTVTGLATKKKYYVKVRTYKTVNGTRYYSGWSNVKSITTK